MSFTVPAATGTEDKPLMMKFESATYQNVNVVSSLPEATGTLH